MELFLCEDSWGGRMFWVQSESVVHLIAVPEEIPF